jgi:putative heme iron utilization protein
LLESQRVAALATLHHGEPYASMVPYALLPSGAGIIIHVSQLSPHTRDMLTSPQVSLLVTAAEVAGVPAQALARITIQGRASQLAETAAEYSAAKDVYLKRFPESAMMFELPDFSLFVIRPRSIRSIAGFAQAVTLTPEAFSRAMSAAS